MSGYSRNNKKRILNNCRSRIRFHLHTAHCRHGYRSVLCCERPPAPDHHPWVPRRSMQGMNDLTTTNNQSVLVFPFSFFLIKHIVLIDFYLYILLLIIYIVTWIHLCLFWKFKAYFFRFVSYPFWFMPILFFGKQANARQMAISSNRQHTYPANTFTLPMTPSKPVSGEILKIPYRIKTKHLLNFYDPLSLFFPCLICIFNFVKMKICWFFNAKLHEPALRRSPAA